jgi:predicted NAD/FAD-binding protein
MNKLQQVSDKYDYFININGDNYVDKSKILRQITYHHPVFDPAAIAAQKKLPLLNTDETPLYFCGSYFRYGFHEDGLMSSVKMCEKMLKERSYEVGSL